MKTPKATWTTRLSEIFLKGLPAAIDADPSQVFFAAELVGRIVSRRDAIYARNVDVFKEWAAIPNVTLLQAAALLTEQDPWQLSQNSVENHKEFVRVCNRLECEVGRALRPLEPQFVSLPLRFYLADVLRVAEARDICTELAVVFRGFLEQSVGAGESTNAAAQTRVEQRINVHRVLINDLRSNDAVVINPIQSKSSTSKRRKTIGHPINVEVNGLLQADYCEAFRLLYRKTYYVPNFWVQDGVIIDDCRALNIAFIAGRKPGSTDTVERRRVRAGEAATGKQIDDGEQSKARTGSSEAQVGHDD